LIASCLDRIGDINQIRRPDVLDRDELLHELVVDMETPGGVDDDDVVAHRAGFGERAFRARHRIHLAGRIVHPHAGLLRHDGQLLDRRRTPHVRRDDNRVAALFRQPLRQLARRRRLARALEPEHQITAAGRGLRSRPWHRRTARAAHRERS
jgi:hypothetical protein